MWVANLWQETALMVWLVVLVGIALFAAVDLWTFRAIGHLPSPRPWRHAAVGLLASGAALGMYFSCFFTYQVAPDLRLIGFPVPALVLHWENGHWVDYVGLIPLVVPLNVFAIASWCLLPVSLGLLTRRLRRGSLARRGDP